MGIQAAQELNRLGPRDGRAIAFALSQTFDQADAMVMPSIAGASVWLKRLA